MLYIDKQQFEEKVNAMGKLRFYYGAMNSLKTGTLLTKVYQFEQCGCNTILLKPSFDSRDYGVIKSRAISNTRECILIHPKDETQMYDAIYCRLSKEKKNVVFVDEVNFISKSHISMLWEISRKFDVDVFTYGLKTNYKNELFEASQELFILADTVEEIKSMCSCCHNKATTHLRYIDGVPTFNGENFVVGDVDAEGREWYTSVCQECWHKVYHEIQ